MKNEDLKKKIISALQSVEFVTEKGWCGQCISLRLDYSAIANALIAAGIGDVSEYKHRAEVAERALEERATYCAMEDFDYFSLTTVAVEARAKELYNGWVQQAEKDLAKEKRNDEH